MKTEIFLDIYKILWEVRDKKKVNQVNLDLALADFKGLKPVLALSGELEKKLCLVEGALKSIKRAGSLSHEVVDLALYELDQISKAL